MRQWKRKDASSLPFVTTWVWGQPGALIISHFWQTLQVLMDEFPQIVSLTMQNQQAPSHHAQLEPRVTAINSNFTFL